jgi:YYY domain-containing protein
MISFLSWYFVTTLLGWLTFPLAWRLFPGLSDRGYTLARSLGLLGWAYIFWLLASLGVLRNDVAGILFGLFAVIALSAWILAKDSAALLDWLKSNLRLVVTTEALFLVAFSFLAVVRAANPEIVGTEKPMELAFINATMRSESFPPNDPWLSGYAISYYYFGYVMTAMLAKLTSVPGGVAFNLMLSLVFALGALGAYGIVYNLLAAYQDHRPPTADRGSLSTVRRPPSTLPLLGPLFLLIFGNLEGLLEVLHRFGLFWRFNADGTAVSSFWNWLAIKDLKDAPLPPLNGVPDRFWWWWRASRVVQDYDLFGNPIEIIDEFPFFSYLLGDLHPHVLALPFGLLAVAAALNLFLGGWRGEIRIFGRTLFINWTGFAFIALLLGGLAFLNTWDILIAAALIVGAYVLARVHAEGWNWKRLEDVFLLGLPLGASAILLYLPFYAGFSSQAGGLLPNLLYPTRGAHLWVMFGTLLPFLFAWLYYLHRQRTPADWRTALYLTLGLGLGLWVFSWLLALLVQIRDPILASEYLASQGIPDLGGLFAAASGRRIVYIGGLLTLLALLIPTLAFLLKQDSREPNGQPSNFQPSIFALFLLLLATLLVLAPDFVYLRDQFGSRMNTVFKFYYQAWQLWALVAAFGAAVLTQNLRGRSSFLFHLFLGVLIVIGLIYPIFGMDNKTNHFKPYAGWTLDGAAHLDLEVPDDAAAIRWLQTAPFGVVAEAVDPGSYTPYARVATHSGLPTVLGWPGHESQWRGGFAEQGTRAQDIEALYVTPDWETAQLILNRYNIRYVFVGTLERTKYALAEEKFFQHLVPVFQQGGTVIYEVPQRTN